MVSEQVTAAPVRVLLVDDEALMRSGLRLLIDGYRGIEVIGEAADGRTALQRISALRPDVVLLDIRMPGLSGLETLELISELEQPPQVVMLTAFDTDEFLLEALRRGAVSFLLKDEQPEEVVQAVLDARDQASRFSPAVLSRLVRLTAAAEPTRTATVGAAEGSRPEAITDREWDVGRLVARGMTNQDIGRELSLSVATVKTHLGRLFDKLQVTNRVQLAITVLELDA